MPLQFYQTEKGRKKLFLDGYFYHKEKQIENKVHWKCEDYQKTKCHAHVTTEGDVIIKQFNEHNHILDIAKVEATKILNDISDSAKNTHDTPQFVIGSVVAECSQVVAAKLPSMDNMKRIIKNIRAKQYDGPAIPLR